MWRPVFSPGRGLFSPKGRRVIERYACSFRAGQGTCQRRMEKLGGEGDPEEPLGWMGTGEHILAEMLGKASSKACLPAAQMR